MGTEIAAKRPRVIGIVGLAIVGGLFGLWVTSTDLEALGQFNAAGVDVPTWITLLVYFNLAVSVLGILAGILILLYKRIGLILAGIVYGLSIIAVILLVVTRNAETNAAFAINLAIRLLVLYYVYVYLTREPDKTFFT